MNRLIRHKEIAITYAFQLTVIYLTTTSCREWKYKLLGPLSLYSSVLGVILLTLVKTKDPGRFERNLEIPTESTIKCFECVCSDQNYVHCYHCGTCIFKKDHHCPWIDNCISFSNHKLFMFYLLADSGSLASIVFGLKGHIVKKVFLSIPLFFIVSLLGYHLFLMILGISSLNFIKRLNKDSARNRNTPLPIPEGILVGS